MSDNVCFLTENCCQCCGRTSLFWDIYEVFCWSEWVLEVRLTVRCAAQGAGTASTKVVHHSSWASCAHDVRIRAAECTHQFLQTVPMILQRRLCTDRLKSLSRSFNVCMMYTNFLSWTCNSGFFDYCVNEQPLYAWAQEAHMHNPVRLLKYIQTWEHLD